MARFEFRLPDIGEGVTEGEIVSWLIKPGDSVTENQEMVEVMTDKATVTIGAPKSGKVVEVRGKEGDVVPVGEVLVVFDLDGGASAEAASSGPSRAEKPRSEPQRPEPQRAEPQRAEAPRPAPAQADRPAEAAKPAPAPEPRPARPAPRAPEARPARDEPAPAIAEDSAVATAVGDLRDVLPGMSGLRAPPTPTISESDGNGSYFNDKPLAAPATRKHAREVSVDLRRVRPTGPGDRVTREDIDRYRTGMRATAEPSHRVHEAVPSPEEPEGAEERAPEEAKHGEPAAPSPIGAPLSDERVPIRGMRKRIYENMARSKHTAAHFTYVDECDASALRALRDRVKPHAERAGIKLSFLPFIVKAVVCALRKHPALNCIVDDAASEMVLKKTYDIGIATATDAGLIVPVVRGAERLSILEIGSEIDRLAGAAREGKVRKEDLGASSFTITSLGRLGGLFATPIVNYPEVAILGVHEIKRRPVIKDDQIVIGEVMLLSLSFDHRIIDGHVGAAFAHEIIDYLEDPDRLLLEMV